MVVTITQFRRDLFALAEKAATGETIEFTHKGVRFRLQPDTLRVSKLGRIQPLPIINPDADLESASRELLNDMQSEWEKDWSEIG